MRIQTNVESLNAYRNLNQTNRAMSRSMERLSSGFRINRAADDAAGLAISEKMRGQISGLTQATRNAQDATSLIQTAEGALNETHSILQRMRELAVQAANDDNTAEDRVQIQEELNQLTSEINRIGNTTEFNTQRLLDGGGRVDLEATNKFIDGSPEGGETTHIQAAQVFNLDEGSELEAATSAEVTGTETADLSSIEGETLTYTVDGGEEQTINFTGDHEDDLSATIAHIDNETGISASEDDGVITITSDSTGSTSTIEITGGTAADDLGLEGLSDTGTDAINEFDVNDGDTINLNVDNQSLVVNFVENTDLADDTIQVDEDSATANSITIEFNEESGIGTDAASEQISEAINLMIAENEQLDGNYEASYDADLSDTDVYTAGGADLSASTNQVGVYALSADEGGEQYGADSYINGITGDNIVDATTNQIGSTTYEAAEYRADFTDNTVETLVGKGFAIDGQQFEFYNSNEGSYTGSATGISLSAVDTGGDQAAELAEATAYQLNNILADNENVAEVYADGNEVVIVAAEDGEGGNCTIEVVDGGISLGFNGQFQIGANTGQSLSVSIDDMRAAALNIVGSEAGATIDVGGGFQAVFTESLNVTDGTTDVNIEYALDVSSHDNATAAISVIDNAIETVSSERSKMGALQNRLEHTIANLEVAAENLTAAESRIRDVDMAAEMTEFTKTQILEQAGTAMLAQANMAPQSVLQLLG